MEPLKFANLKGSIYGDIGQDGRASSSCGPLPQVQVEASGKQTEMRDPQEAYSALTSETHVQTSHDAAVVFSP